MTGREDKKTNDLFYTCSLIDYMARKTRNKRKDIVNALGNDKISKGSRWALSIFRNNERHFSINYMR